MKFPSFRTSGWAGLALAAALPALSNAQTSHEATQQWQLGEEQQFFFEHGTGAFSGIFRTQGIATDGEQWIFSWQYGLETADPQFRSVRRNSSILPPKSGIPLDLLLLHHLDHIGDIDYHDGIIYASLDNTNGFNNGHVALYNAANLSYTGVSYALTGAPSNPKHDIASWVAIDPSGTLGYGKEYQLGNTINLYQLPGWTFAGTKTLDLALEQIQGAKVYGNWLYMSSNDDAKAVYRANLQTGHVEVLFTLPAPAGRREVEGIAVRSARQVCIEAQAQHPSPRDCARLGDDAADIYVEMVVDPDNAGNNIFNPNIHVSLYHYAVQP